MAMGRFNWLMKFLGFIQCMADISIVRILWCWFPKDSCFAIWLLYQLIVLIVYLSLFIWNSLSIWLIIWNWLFIDIYCSLTFIVHLELIVRWHRSVNNVHLIFINTTDKKSICKKVNNLFGKRSTMSNRCPFNESIWKITNIWKTVNNVPIDVHSMNLFGK